MTLNDFIFRCIDNRFETKEGAKESPYVVKVPDEKILEELSDQKFWGKFKSFLKSDDKKQFALTCYQTI